MKKMLAVMTGLGALVVAGVAVAQAPTPPAPPPGPGPGAEMHMGEHGPGEHGGRGMMQGMHRHPTSKSAHFMFRRGDAVVAIKCADDEPTKACVDAAAIILDKLTASPK